MKLSTKTLIVSLLIMVVLSFLILGIMSSNNSNKFTKEETLSNYKKVVTVLSRQKQIGVNETYVQIPVVRNDGGGGIIISEDHKPNSKYTKITRKDGVVEHQFVSNTSIVNLGAASYVRKDKCWNGPTNIKDAIYETIPLPSSGKISQTKEGEVIIASNSNGYMDKVIISYDVATYKLTSFKEFTKTPDITQNRRQDIFYGISNPYISQGITCK